MTAHYSRDQEAGLRAALAGGHPPHCPVCDVEMDVETVRPRADVSYVRRRRWLRCGVCGRSLVVDVPRGAP